MVARSAARRPTHRRWEAALARAAAEGIAVLADDGTRALVSSSNGRTIYVIVNHRCSCPAAAASDTCCKHLAAWHLYLESLDPEPSPAPAVRPAVKRVRWTGSSYVECGPRDAA
jgi:hypothetical protein